MAYNWEGTYEFYLVEGRYEVRVWPFGGGWQTGISIEDPEHRRGERVWLPFDSLAESKDVAQRRAEAFIEDPSRLYRSPDEFADYLYDRWRSLYRSRLRVLESWFLTIGGGTEWLDGHLVSTSLSETELTWEEHCDEKIKNAEEIAREYEEAGEDPSYPLSTARYYEKQKLLEKGPDPVAEQLKRDDLYPSSRNYSNIYLVPDNVTPEWMGAAKECLELLRGFRPEEAEEIEAEWAERGLI